MIGIDVFDIFMSLKLQSCDGRIVMIKLVRMSLFAAAAVAVPSMPVSAQPMNNDEIVISAPQKANLDDNQLSVQFRDLALNHASGQTALMHRVGFAIESLCGSTVASSNPVGAMKCSNVAWNNVQPQLDALLKR